MAYIAADDWGKRGAFRMDVIICIGSSCHLRGSRDVIQMMEKLVNSHHVQEQVELQGSFCMGECTNGVCVSVDGEKFHLTPDKVEAFFEKEILGRLNN